MEWHSVTALKSGDSDFRGPPGIKPCWCSKPGALDGHLPGADARDQGCSVRGLISSLLHTVIFLPRVGPSIGSLVLTCTSAPPTLHDVAFSWCLRQWEICSASPRVILRELHYMKVLPPFANERTWTQELPSLPSSPAPLLLSSPGVTFNCYLTSLDLNFLIFKIGDNYSANLWGAVFIK